jgi:DNA-binding response OmpR family regulator|nr:response regulator transcription factor [uncultured Pedobacter sp.]
MKILIVEDEKPLSDSMVAYLSKENYLCETAFDFISAKQKIAMFEYDCILLDIMLPDGNGLQLLAYLKESCKMDGVIIISAKNSLEDRISSLKLGADDYLSKPFHLAELSARIQSLIRRTKLNGQHIIIYRDTILDLRAKTLFVKEEPVELTKTEFELYLFLVTNKGKVISKNAIAEHISGESAIFLDNFDVIYAHVKNLKKKLGESGTHLKTIYGVGYKLES